MSGAQASSHRRAAGGTGLSRYLPALAVQAFLVADGSSVGYELAPMTWKDWLTKM